MLTLYKTASFSTRVYRMVDKCSIVPIIPVCTCRFLAVPVQDSFLLILPILAVVYFDPIGVN